MADPRFWKNKKVFITGHTGFKGAWLCLWLNLMGAKISGYALRPPTRPSLFDLCGVDEIVSSHTADIRNFRALRSALISEKPEIVIHMAAQPLVRESYSDPVGTYTTNVIGTVNLLEAVRSCGGVKALVNVTTDKCYENKESSRGYREADPLGGFDPYSSSKACSELVTAAYRSSFLGDKMSVATARAGNTIGGGDWGADRLVPDLIKALMKSRKLLIRSPRSVRPWQHVLEPLSGYLLLSERLYEDGAKYAEAWNFGPDHKDARNVEWIVKRLISKLGGVSYAVDRSKQPHETSYLSLDASKAKKRLGWRPVWDVETAIDMVVDWTNAYKAGKDVKKVCLDQIKTYMEEK